MHVGFVTPAHGRQEVTRLACAQRRQLVDALAVRGITADCVVLACDDNLDVAADLGFTGLYAENVLGRRVNDGIEHVYERGADWVCFAGSDNWLHPNLFDGLDERSPEHIVSGRTLAVVDLASGRSIVSRPGGNKGVAPWLIPRALFDRHGNRPAGDTATSGMEMQLAIGLGLPSFVFHDPNPCARVDFKSGVNMTAFAAFYRPGLPEARLRDFYPADLCDLVDAHAMVAA